MSKHQALKMYEGIEAFLARGSRWKTEVIFTIRSLYPPGTIPQDPMDRRVGEPQGLYLRSPSHYWPM
jgi:hypothetical protein